MILAPRAMNFRRFHGEKHTRNVHLSVNLFGGDETMQMLLEILSALPSKSALFGLVI